MKEGGIIMKYLIGGIIVAAIVVFGINNIGTKKMTQITGPEIEYKKISQEEAKNRLDSEKDVILLDVRTIEEYKENHIPNSMLISVDVIENEIVSKIPNKESKIFIYCRSGNRSKIATGKVISMGYKNVYDIGGIIDWKYETESSK